LEQPFIADTHSRVHARDLMNRNWGGDCCKSHALFRLRFEMRLRKLLERGYSVAEGFGPAWEWALEEAPLEEDEQGSVYRELIHWAGTAKLFTPGQPVGPVPAGVARLR
jgi:hypothetical protein